MANINDRINGQEFESASPLAHAVRYDRAQVKTEEQKKQARENIGCYCEAGGGGGGGSSGGETLIVGIEPIADENKADRTLRVSGGDIGKKFNKTAKEVFDACKTSNDVIFVETGTETVPGLGLTTVTNIYSLTATKLITDGSHSRYVFELTGVDDPTAMYSSTSTRRYIAVDDNDYPSTD